MPQNDRAGRPVGLDRPIACQSTHASVKHIEAGGCNVSAIEIGICVRVRGKTLLKWTDKSGCFDLRTRLTRTLELLQHVILVRMVGLVVQLALAVVLPERGVSSRPYLLHTQTASQQPAAGHSKKKSTLRSGGISSERAAADVIPPPPRCNSTKRMSGCVEF